MSFRPPLVLLLLAGLALAGCGGSDDEPAATAKKSTSTSASASPTVDVTPPEVGECRTLQQKDIPPRSNASPTVPCTGAHTARTYAVPTVAFEATTPEARQRTLANNVCFTLWADAVGGTQQDRDGSVFGYAFFRPTAAQVAAGARWVRCDVVAATGKRTLPLLAANGDGPEITEDLAAGGGLPEAYRLCVDAKGNLLSCAQPHRYTFRTSHTSSAKGAWPGKEALDAEGRRVCAAPTAYYFYWPGKVSWNLGYRQIRCFT